MLRKIKAGHIIDNAKINNLLFMDDIKLFLKVQTKINNLVPTVRVISKDIGIEFGIQKCRMLVLKGRN